MQCSSYFIALCVTGVAAAFRSSCDSFRVAAGLSLTFLIIWCESVLCCRAWCSCPGMISCGSMKFPPMFYETGCADMDVYGLCYVAFFPVRVLCNNVGFDNFRKLLHHDRYLSREIFPTYSSVFCNVFFYPFFFISYLQVQSQKTTAPPHSTRSTLLA